MDNYLVNSHNPQANAQKTGKEDLQKKGLAGSQALSLLI